MNPSPRLARGLASLALALLAAQPFSGHAASDEIALFNGRNLDGWEGHADIWFVRDGAITGQTRPETALKHNTFLVWKGGTIEDFELRLSYRIVGGNSGIQYRSRVVQQGAQGPIVGGYQADFEAGTTYSGILYEERGRGILAQRGQFTRITPADDGRHRVTVLGSLGRTEDIQAGIKPEQWNDYLIVARGNRLTHLINGRVTADVIDDDPARAAASGVLAFQVHVGPPMTVQFKDIRLRHLAPAPAPTLSDLDRLAGEWIGHAGRRDGFDIPADWLSQVHLKIEGDRYDVRWDDGGDRGTITLDPSASPKRMDIDGTSAGRVYGIYELSGDQLRVAYTPEGGPRPRNFDTPAGSSTLTITYRRK
ncbi:MAG: DUF1080 domain-containing protein [Verrucomicrobiae bacterium]|nr:DUF1080 domain-containing protein [Verrucomicrobiae bacterium]